MKARIATVTLGILLLSAAARGGIPTLEVELVPDRARYAPGDTVVLAVVCKIPRGYHLYGNPLGPGTGKPFLLDILGGDAVSWWGARKKPARKYHLDKDEWVWAYKREAVFFLLGTVGADPGRRIKGRVLVEGLLCRDACVTVEETQPFALKVGKGQTDGERFGGSRRLARRYRDAEEISLDALRPERVATDEQWEGTDPFAVAAEIEEIPEWDYDPVERKARMNLPAAVLLAFLAGIILNFMPCVLPVLGIKILTLARGREESRRKTFLRSLAFSGGMLLVFLILASLAAAAGYSWGQQFQTPGMLAGIVTVIVVFALGMFDFYTILVPGRLVSLGNKGGEGIVGDLVKGMFTTILATPCSGPLLGATLAWTLRQPAVMIYTVFLAIGLGMSLPYVLLASSSTLSRIVPKPGPWMEDFKRVMGFLLLGFAVYLMTGLPRGMVISTVGLCVFVALALFVYGRVAPFGAAAGRKALGAAAALAIALIGWYVTFDLWYGSISERAGTHSGDGTEWVAFSPRLLTDAHLRGRHTIVDFTASWCINCQYNKISVLHSRDVAELLEQKDVLTLRADITQSNPSAESLLHHLGSRSVPFFALFPGDDPYHPLVMRDILRKKKVVAALEGLAEK